MKLVCAPLNLLSHNFFLHLASKDKLSNASQAGSGRLMCNTDLLQSTYCGNQIYKLQ